MTNTQTKRSPATVRSVMSRALLTVESEESVLMAFELASRAGIHHLPVMASDGQCVGLVGLETLRAWSIGPLGQPRPPVRDLADRRLLHVSPSSSLRKAALVMDANEADALLVLDRSQLVGLLTWRDVVRHVAGLDRPDHAAPHASPVLFSLDPVIELPERG